MQEEKNGWQNGKKATLTPLKPAKHRAKSGADSQFDALRRAALLAADELISTLSDENQFFRHAYQDKGSGEIMEATLKIRNIKQLRETICAIRELTDLSRSLYGLLSPTEEKELEMQLKKLQLDEKKLTSDTARAGAETGVVLLPEPEEEKPCPT